MSKNREAVTCNGRAAFYACMWEDIRKCAMDCGWAVALHGSLFSDMDIMAMPWTNDSVSFKELANSISKLFDGNFMSELYSITYNEKPHGRIVATIPIYGDHYLDISTIEAVPVVYGCNNNQNYHEVDEFRCSVYGLHLEDWERHVHDGGAEFIREYEFKYCPECGARMKGGENE